MINCAHFKTSLNFFMQKGSNLISDATLENGSYKEKNHFLLQISDYLYMNSRKSNLWQANFTNEAAVMSKYFWIEKSNATATIWYEDHQNSTILLGFDLKLLKGNRNQTNSSHKCNFTDFLLIKMANFYTKPCIQKLPSHHVFVWFHVTN